MKHHPLFGAVCYYEFSGDLIDFIREIDRLGLKWIEYKYDKSLIGRGESSDTAIIGRALKDAGIGMSIHTPFDGLNIGSTDEAFRIQSVDELKRSIDYAADIGAPSATIHGGQISPVEYTSENWDKSVAANLNSLIELAEYGKGRGVALCLENGNAYERQWLKHANHHGEMKLIRSQIEENLFYTVDFGHALYFSSDPSFMIRELGQNNVLMTHLHDNQGMFDSHSDLGKGMLNLDALLSTMIEDNWTFPVCLEMKTSEHLQHSVKTLTNSYDKVRERMEQSMVPK